MSGIFLVPGYFRVIVLFLISSCVRYHPLFLYLMIALAAMWVILHGIYVEGGSTSKTNSASSCLQNGTNETEDTTGEIRGKQASDAANQIGLFFGLGNITEVRQCNHSIILYVHVYT